MVETIQPQSLATWHYAIDSAGARWVLCFSAGVVFNAADRKYMMFRQGSRGSGVDGSGFPRCLGIAPHSLQTCPDDSAVNDC